MLKERENLREIPDKKIPASDVDKAIFEVYGKYGLETFNEIYDKHPDWPLEKVVREFEAGPVNTQTYFFRTENLSIAAEQIIKKIEKKEGGPVQILEVGCSSGEESYSFATEIMEVGVNNFHITGIDVELESLSEADQGEYELDRPLEYVEEGYSKLTRDHFSKGYFEDSGKTWEKTEKVGGPSPSEMFRDQSFMQEYFKFDKDGQRIRIKDFPKEWYRTTKLPIVRPTKKVRDKITFEPHDIIDGPVPGGYDLALVNYVLVHYPDKTRDKIMKNILASLKTGGYLVLESPMGPIRDEEKGWLNPYREWRKEMAERFNLEDVPVKQWYFKKDDPSEPDGNYFKYLGPKG